MGFLPAFEMNTKCLTNMFLNIFIWRKPLRNILLSETQFQIQFIPIFTP